jgi:hypothetical protein
MTVKIFFPLRSDAMQPGTILLMFLATIFTVEGCGIESLPTR